MRAFLAMDLGESAARAVHEVGLRLSAIASPWGWEVGWVAPEKIHLTLKFFGNVPPNRVDAIVDAVTPACAVHAPAEVTVRGIGSFPERAAPSVLWIGVDDPRGVLPALVRDLEERLAAIGLPREKRPFHPHVTLGRVKTRGNVRLSDAYPALGSADCGATLLDSVTLYESRLKDGTYHALKRIPLRGETR